MNNSSQPTNIFAMFQKNSNCHYPCVRIDFTEIKDHSQSIAKGENVFKKIIPSFNNDGLYFTDAFVLESQTGKKSVPPKNMTQEQDHKETKEKFESKVQKQNSNMDIEEMYPPEPESFFCQICRQPFENYYNHIEDRDHIRNLQFSKGYKYIKQICKQAKKHFNQNETNQQPETIEEEQKIKPIHSKKVTTAKRKKSFQEERKIISTGQKAGSDSILQWENAESSGSRSQKNDQCRSIINSQMKLSAVEKVNLQSINSVK